MKRRFSAGYTIVEVMIVLAVTTALFLSVVTLLGGKQAKNEANQAVRDLESKIQTVASDVANGYYRSGYTCTASLVPGTAVKIANTSAGSGENLGCIFLGKVINFGDTSESANIITVLGRQFTGAIGSADPVSIDAALPVAVTINPPLSLVDVTDVYLYKFGMKISKIVQINGGASVGAFGFMSQLGGGVSGSSLTGSRSTLLYGLDGTSPNNNSASTTGGTIDTAGSLYAIPGGVRICLLTGDGKKAEITVGANNSQTATFVALDTGVPAGDC